MDMRAPPFFWAAGPDIFVCRAEVSLSNPVLRRACVIMPAAASTTTSWKLGGR
jgi:hypothetical protein